MQIARDLGELEAVRRGERQHDVVLGRGRLELEVELAAEALAQRQAPGAIDAAAIGRMDHELHAARGIEEALEDDGVMGGQGAERAVACGEVVHELLRRGLAEPYLLGEPREGVLHWNSRTVEMLARTVPLPLVGRG